MRTLSFRTVRDTRVSLPDGSAGKTVGRMQLYGVTTDGLSTGFGPYRLRMPPRPSGRTVLLLRRRALRVVLRPRGGAGAVLSVYGLPPGVQRFELRLEGAGRGIIAATHPCPVQPTVRLVTVRSGAGTAVETSAQRCF